MNSDDERAHAHDALRRANRQRRAALDADALDAAARALAARLLALPEYRDARRIAAYLAIRGEIGLGPVIDDALAHDKRVFLPILRGERMRFAPWFDGQALRGGRFGLSEPEVDEQALVDPAGLDLVLTPLTVFDADCRRIGQGGGYYDRCFAFRREPGNGKPLLVGVAHDWQRTARIEPNPWDVPLDLVVTDAALYHAPG